MATSVTGDVEVVEGKPLRDLVRDRPSVAFVQKMQPGRRRPVMVATDTVTRIHIAGVPTRPAVGCCADDELWLRVRVVLGRRPGAREPTALVEEVDRHVRAGAGSGQRRPRAGSVGRLPQLLTVASRPFRGGVADVGRGEM